MNFSAVIISFSHCMEKHSVNHCCKFTESKDIWTHQWSCSYFHVPRDYVYWNGRDSRGWENSTAGCTNSSCCDHQWGNSECFGIGWAFPLHLYPAGLNPDHLLHVQALNKEGVISRWGFGNRSIGKGLFSFSLLSLGTVLISIKSWLSHPCNKSSHGVSWAGRDHWVIQSISCSGTDTPTIPLCPNSPRHLLGLHPGWSNTFACSFQALVRFVLETEGMGAGEQGF